MIPFRLSFLFKFAVLCAWLVHSNPSRAKPCSAEVIKKLNQARPATCAEAQQNLSTLNSCDEVAGLAEAKRVANTRLSMVCCKDAATRIDAKLNSKPRECTKKYHALNAVDYTVASCQPTLSAEISERLNDLRMEVATCSCEEGKQAKFQAGSLDTCEAAKRARSRLALWLSCPEQPENLESEFQRADAVVRGCDPNRSEQKELPPPRPPRELFEETRAALEQINQQIQNKPQCSAPKACPEWRKEQLALFALYLDFFSSTTVTNETDLKHALQLMRNVGLPPEALVYVGECSDHSRGNVAPCSLEDIRAAVNLWTALGNPKVVPALRNTLKEPGGQQLLDEIVAARAQGVPYPVLARKIMEAPAEAREALFDAARPLGYGYDDDAASEAWKKKNDQELRRLDVVIATDPETKVCDHFVNHLLWEVRGRHELRDPVRVTPEKFEATLDSLARARHARCGTDASSAHTPQGKAQTELGCGPIVGIYAKELPEGAMAGRAALRFVSPGEIQEKDLPTVEFSVALPAQERAAGEVARAIRMTYDTVAKSPNPSPPSEPAEHCGVTLLADAAVPVLPPPTGQGLTPQYQWADRERGSPLEHRLTYDLGQRRHAVGPVGSQGLVVLRLTSRPPVDARHRIFVELERKEGGGRLLAFSLVVDERAQCNDPLNKSRQTRWELAGSLAAQRIARYYSTVETKVTGATAGRLLLPGVEWWDSDSVGKRIGGVAWSIGDVALFGSGVLMLGLSIHERNAFAEGSGSLDKANTFQYVGFGLLGAFLLERIVWAALPSERLGEQ